MEFCDAATASDISYFICLDTGSNQGNVAFTISRVVKRVSNSQINRRPGRNVDCSTLSQSRRLDVYIWVAGFETDVECIVDVPIVPNLPVDSSSVFTSAEYLLRQIEILDIYYIGLRNCEPYTDCRLVAGIILAGRYNYDFIGLVGYPVGHWEEEHHSRVASERVNTKSLFSI